MNRNIGFSIVLSAFLVFAPTAKAQVINACVNKKTGAIRIGTPCKKTESPLSWNVGGALQVFDTNGQLVGDLMIDNQDSYAVRKINGALTALHVAPTGFASAAGVNLFYESNDCSGQPFLDNQGEPRFELVSVGSLMNGTFYYQSGPSVPMTGGSIIFGDPAADNSGSITCQDFEGTGPFQVAPFASFDPSTLNLVPPFIAK